MQCVVILDGKFQNKLSSLTIINYKRVTLSAAIVKLILFASMQSSSHDSPVDVSKGLQCAVVKHPVYVSITQFYRSNGDECLHIQSPIYMTRYSVFLQHRCHSHTAKSVELLPWGFIIMYTRWKTQICEETQPSRVRLSWIISQIKADGGF